MPRLVATSPEDAVARLARTFGERPTLSGRGNPGIAAFREWLFDHTGNGRSKDALMLVAPHTHWDEGLPIVYRAPSPGRYLVGPTRIVPDAIYHPVSFVFAEGGALAYEWADPSIGLGDSELAALYPTIDAAAERFWREGWPLGVTINFRFKASLFDDRPVDNIEREIAGDPDEQSEIVQADTAVVRDILQVAWHCYSDRCYGLSLEEAALIDQLRTLSDKMDASEWANAIAQAIPRT